MTILHISDLHFGKAHRPRAAAAVLRVAEENNPVAVVASGDFTQRAKSREYRSASRFLRAIAQPAEAAARPVVVTPGNHDVPLYRVWERAFAPYRKYRAHISKQIDTALDVSGGGARARFVALSSAAPWSAIVNGRLARAQLRYARRAFAASPPGALRVLVVHHNLVDPCDGLRAPTLPGARRVLARARDWGVDLVLSGHIHRTHLGCAKGVHGAPDDSASGVGPPVVIAGTASSSRGREPKRGAAPST